MNERIRELAEQAGVYFGKARKDYFGEEYPPYISTRNMDVAKFAELIVKKCAEISLSHQDFPETEQTIRRWVAEDIERHFGVKK